MYNVMNKQINTNLFPENKYTTMIPLSDSWSQNRLVHRSERGKQNTNNTDIMDIKDFTIYRG